MTCRYVDMIMNPEVAAVFRNRAKVRNVSVCMNAFSVKALSWF